MKEQKQKTTGEDTMAEKIRLLIAADTRDTARISSTIMQSKGYDVDVCPKDGKLVLQEIIKKAPDVVIIEMFMANLDAIAVLKALKSENLLKKPAVIVSANYDNGLVEKEVMEAGAGYFILKPFDYDVLCERINMLATGFTLSHRGDRTPLEDIDLEVMVTDILHQIGVPAHIKGYHYLRTSIILAIEDRDMINHITKELYPTVARRFKTTATRVERAIRHAIEVAWDRGDVDVLNSYFGFTIHSQKGKPTNSEFVAMIADKICLKIKMA